MASVWRAHDVTLDRRVAVKRLHAPHLDDPELSERFRREAQVVARLAHPNLVRLLDGGEEPDGPFLVFELVEGRDLKAIVRAQGPLDPVMAAQTCAQVADALAYAHERGVVHRDIKSRNVMVTADGQAKLTDFGIARLIEADAASGLTRTGTMIGTSDYLAPEQAEGLTADPRTDVYSLGVVLYECLTGELPYHGETPLAVALQHIREPMPDPRRLAPNVPPHVAAAVLRATEKDPERRFQRAADLREALLAPERAGRTAVLPPLELADEGDTGRLQRRRSRRAVWAAAGTAVAVAAVAAALWATGVLDTGGSDTSPASAADVALPIQAVRDFDPEGDGQENPTLRGNAIDSDPATVWTTETYYDSPVLADHRKSGVGLLFRLARPARATEMDIVSPSAGAEFEVLGPGAEGSRPVYAHGTIAGGTAVQRVLLHVPSPASVYVLWFTKLVSDPKTQGGYDASVGQVRFRGAANP
jgi:serine/threonine-protein kinase